MRGQLSIEFIVVLSGVLLIAYAISIPMYQHSRDDADKISKLAYARKAALDIKNALNTVYAGGVGSRVVFGYRLPEGIVGIHANASTDGIVTSDGVVSSDNRMDVQIWLDLNEDGQWDNKMEAVVLLNTILPSGVNENSLIINDENFGIAQGLHQVTLIYEYRGGRRYITIRGG